MAGATGGGALRGLFTSGQHKFLMSRPPPRPIPPFLRTTPTQPATYDSTTTPLFFGGGSRWRRVVRHADTACLLLVRTHLLTRAGLKMYKRSGDLGARGTSDVMPGRSIRFRLASGDGTETSWGNAATATNGCGVYYMGS